MKLKTLSIGIAVSLLVSCGGGSRVPTQPPTPLASFEQAVELKARWSLALPSVKSKSVRAFFSLLPAVHGGNLFATSHTGIVIATDRTTGESVWTTTLSEGVTAGVGVGASIVLVVTESGRVVALEVADGSQRWELDLGEVVFTPPLVYRETVIVRTINGNLHGISAESGELLWDTIYEQPEFVKFGPSRPVGLNEVVVAGYASGRVIATDIKTGFETWQIYLGSERGRDVLRNEETFPVIDRGQLLISDSPKAVVAYDLDTGNVVWESRRSAFKRIEVDFGRVYGSDLDSKIFALDREDGSVRWEQEAFLHRKVENLVLMEGFLIVDDGAGYLHVLDVSNGDIVGRFRANESVVSDGFLADGRDLYVVFRSGRVQALTLTTLN